MSLSTVVLVLENSFYCGCADVSHRIALRHSSDLDSAASLLPPSVPSTIQSQSPALLIELHACLSARDRILRAQIHPPALIFCSVRACITHQEFDENESDKLRRLWCQKGM